MTEKHAVLIVAPSDDAHANAVAAVLRRDFDARVIIWDSSSFPSENTISFAISNRGVGCQFSSHGEQLSLASFGSIWWRRPGMHLIDRAIVESDVRQFCKRESEMLFRGALSAVDVPVVNPIDYEIVASRKSLQLRAAAHIGLSIPNTLVTNNTTEARDFYCLCEKRCIYKCLTPPRRRMAETRMMSEDNLAHLDALRYAPVILQEKIEKGSDIRINIFGSRVFAAEVTTYRDEADLDWRLDLTAKWNMHYLPDSISSKLLEFLRYLNLSYGCIDMRKRPDGEYVFLEVNPSGQFLFIEIDTGQPLSSAMAELLVAPVAMC